MAVQTPAVVFHPHPPQAAVPAAPAAPRSPSVGLDDLNSCMTCSRLRLGAEMLSWYSCSTAGRKGRMRVGCWGGGGVRQHSLPTRGQQWLGTLTLPTTSHYSAPPLVFPFIIHSFAHPVNHSVTWHHSCCSRTCLPSMEAMCRRRAASSGSEANAASACSAALDGALSRSA